MKNIENKVVAITGAASGIGRELAVNLAREKCSLALSDINEEGLQETAQMVSGGDVKVTTSVVDVADRERVYKWADEVVDLHGGVDIIINNAGVPVSETIEDLTYEDFEWAFNIVFWGVVYGSKAFLPHLKKRPEGHIVNISSINAILPFPNNGPYNCAKAAVKLLNMTLLQELRGSSIKVMSVHPGGIKTNIVRNMRFRRSANPTISHEEAVEAFDKIATTSAEKAALKIIRGIKKNKKRLMIGIDSVIMDMMERIFPVSSNALVGMLTKRQRSL